MSIIKTATLLPVHTFTTIILSYSVVMFWSSSSLLLSVSTPGNNQLRFCLFGHCWLSLIKFRDMLNKIGKEVNCLTQKSEIKVTQNAKCSQNREIMVSRNMRTSKSRNKRVAKISCNKVCNIYTPRVPWQNDRRSSMWPPIQIDHTSITSSITSPNSKRTNVYTFIQNLKWLSTISRVGHYNCFL